MVDTGRAKRAADSRNPKPLAKRTEMVAVRLVPKLKYAAEIAARSQRRTVSSLVEVAVANYLPTLSVAVPTEGGEQPIKLMTLMESLWDPDDSDRFVKLAKNQRWLLDNEEELRWKAIRERFGAKGPLTDAQRIALRDIYKDIKKQVSEALRVKEMAKFAEE